MISCLNSFFSPFFSSYDIFFSTLYYAMFLKDLSYILSSLCVLQRILWLKSICPTQSIWNRFLPPLVNLQCQIEFSWTVALPRCMRWAPGNLFFCAREGRGENGCEGSYRGERGLFLSHLRVPVCSCTAKPITAYRERGWEGGCHLCAALSEFREDQRVR